MNANPYTPTRFVLLSLLAFGPAALWAPAPAGAQQIPWIGLAANGAQLHGEDGQYPHSPGAGDHFGFAVAAGDFNNDGFDDLASGVPYNDCDVVVWDCGSVQVRFGGGAVPLAAWVTLDPAAPGVLEPAEANDQYGAALATGDFDGDGYDDLAVGVPGNETDPFERGAVHVHHGLPGLSGSIHALAEDVFSPGQNGLPGSLYFRQRFGHSVTFGDFNGDGRDDLAVGAPYALQICDTGFLCRAGGVTVIERDAEGGIGAFYMGLGVQGLPEVAELEEQFGYALAAGDFDGDGYEDLAIAVPSEDDVGAVLVVYGSPFSLIFADHWYFSSFTLGGEPQPGMRFGEAMAAGDFDGDGFDDLAIGAPRFDGQGEPQPVDMGLVSVVYGAVFGLTPFRVHWIYEHVLYGPGNGEAVDLFGAALAAGDFDGDGVDDLAIGTPGENLESTNHPNTGAVSVVPGRPFEGLTGAPRQLRPHRGDSNNGNIVDPAGLIPDYRSGDPLYGSSLAAGDFDGSGIADLAIGAESRDDLALVNAGAVAVLYGQLFADGFETGSAGAWSSAVP